MNRENIINSILNESWDDDDRCYNDYDYYDANGFSISDCDIDDDIECNVSFLIEKALERAVSKIEPRRTSEIVARIISILKNDGAQITFSKVGEKLLSFDSSYSWNEMKRYENGDEAPEGVYDDIMNIFVESLRKVADSLPLDVELLFEQIDEEMMNDEDLIIINYDVDLEEYAKEYWEDSESIKRSDEADYLSWRRS